MFGLINAIRGALLHGRFDAEVQIGGMANKPDRLPTRRDGEIRAHH